MDAFTIGLRNALEQAADLLDDAVYAELIASFRLLIAEADARVNAEAEYYDKHYQIGQATLNASRES